MSKPKTAFIDGDAEYRCTSYGNGYFTFEVDSYETFIREIAPKFTKTKDTFVWRGMRNPEWDLQSSMSRVLAKMKTSGNDWKVKATRATIKQLRYYLENLRGLSQQTREFGDLYAALDMEEKQDYLSFVNVLYNLKRYERTILELFALGQHHRMLTPFLDWTTTPLIALYFAFESADERPDGVGDRVVFALNRTQVEEECPPCQLPNDDWVIFTDSMAHDNPRIIGQNGLFSFVPASVPLDRWVVARDNFKSVFKPVLIRFLIQNRNREACLRELELSGIDSRSIYPDLEGAALKANSKLTQYLRNPI